MRTRALLLLVAMLATALFPPVTPASARDITLNFKGADIRTFIEFVAAFSGKNFLIDNRVQGNVTIVSPTPISETQAYSVFLSVLEVNGFAAVPSGPVIKIVPMAEGKSRSVPLSVGGAPDNDGLVTQVLPLKYADAQQLVALLRPLVSPNSYMMAYPGSNMMLLVDNALNVKRIQELIEVIDRKDAVGVRLFPLQYASADKLAQTLTAIYTATPGVPQQNQVKVMAHQPGNMLVAVGATPVLAEIAEVVAKLDVRPTTDSGRLQVRYLKHARAEDTAKVLNEVLGSQQPAAAAAGSKPALVGDVKVVADVATNALLITADPADMPAINRMIDKLDIRRLQVLIEALIVEVSGDAAEQLGVEWMSGKTIQNGQNTVVGGQNYGTLTQVGGALAKNAAAANPVNTTMALAGALPQGLTIGLLKGSLAAGNISLGAILQALESTTDANVLSTPNILTMDNEAAEIIVGQNVPFVTGQNSTQGGTANPFQTIERKDIGLTLKVKPQISEGDNVRLEIYQEVSSISTAATTGASDLVTNKRSVKTVALAKDQQMLVLGGLMREDVSTTVNRVPCLGSIPLFGEPFQSTTNIRRKTNLMVFLRPRIIRTDQDVHTVTQEKYLNMERLYETPSPRGTLLYPREKKELPESMRPQPPVVTRPEEAVAEPAAAAQQTDQTGPTSPTAPAPAPESAAVDPYADAALAGDPYTAP